MDKDDGHTLLDLAERCEAAVGRDREMDAEIEIAFHGFPQMAYDHRNSHYSSDRLAFVGEWIGTRYTASLDAAMTLLTTSAFVIDCATQTTQYSQPVAHVWNEAGKHTAKARTPALALCAAALRARASIEMQQC